jgi:uncharacterized protein (TIGR02117 family)
MKTARIFFKFVLGLFGFVVFYVMLVLLLSKITVNTDVLETGKTIPIYILSNGVHTDIVVPVKNEYYDWSKQIKFEHTKAKDSTSKYLAIGWGDKGFYLETPTWADLKLSTALKAATGVSSSAMHCTFHKKMKVNKKCKTILLSDIEYKQLVSFIQDSFETKNDNLFKIETDAVYGDNDAFYEAKGSYSLFYTCNTWTNNALKAANQKAALWTPYEGGVFCHYE